MKANYKTVLVFGIGKLGGAIVDTLSKRFPANRFVLVSRNKDKSRLRVNLSIYQAIQWSITVEIIAEECDLTNLTKCAELINKYKPEIIVNATTPFPWWKLDHLPSKYSILANDAGPGVWCALDCILPLALTNAIKESNHNCIHINACYPDMTNVFLSTLKCSPLLGIGNISNLIPGLKLAFSKELSINPNEIDVRIIGHHYISWNAPNNSGCSEAPYHITIIHPNGRINYTGPDDSPFALLRQNASRVRGLEGLSVTIGSASTVIAAFLNNVEDTFHCPGVNGLPGGYPVLLNQNGTVSINLPFEVDIKTAISINEIAQTFDGISTVKGGSVIATEKAKEAHFEIVGTDLPEITFANVLEFSKESIIRLNEKYNLKL